MDAQYFMNKLDFLVPLVFTSHGKIFTEHLPLVASDAGSGWGLKRVEIGRLLFIFFIHFKSANCYDEYLFLHV